MPIELVDDTGAPVDLDKASGGFLRTKLEEALEENKDLSKQISTARATTAISEHGYSLVKPEDLAGVPPDQVEAKAKELQGQRIEARTQAVKSVLVERGLKDEELEAALEGVLGDSGKPVEPENLDPNFAGMANIGGNRPDNKKAAPEMTDPMGNLTAHFEDSASKK